MSDLERLVILIDPLEKDRLMDLAEEDDRSMSYYVRRLIQNAIAADDAVRRTQPALPTNKRLTPQDVQPRLDALNTEPLHSPRSSANATSANLTAEPV